MHSRTIALSLLMMTGCGGNVTPVEDVPADAAASPLLFQGKYVGVVLPPNAPMAVEFQCLPKRLPLGTSDLPDCVVVEARFPPDAGTPNEVDACQQCAEPGLEPFISPVPLGQIGAGLEQFQCLCQVVPLPRGAACPGVGEGAGWTSSWCYAEGAEAPEVIGCGGAAIIGLSDLPAPDATLFVACFSPNTSD